MSKVHEADYDGPDECWNCDGEGFVTGCSWDWQCDTYDSDAGDCLCTRACHICSSPHPSQGERSE